MNLTHALQIPAGAVFFGVKDVCRRELLELGLGRELATALAVGAANLPYWLVRCPAELLKTRQQTAVGSFGSIDDLKAFVSAEGLGGVYASYPSNLLYALPADLLKFLACTYRLKLWRRPHHRQTTCSPAYSTTPSREARWRDSMPRLPERWPASWRRR